MSSAARRKLFTLAMFDAITDLKYYETKLHKYTSERRSEKRENAEMLILHFHFTISFGNITKSLQNKRSFLEFAWKKLDVCFSFNLIKFSMQDNQADCEKAENELDVWSSEDTVTQSSLQRNLALL